MFFCKAQKQQNNKLVHDLDELNKKKLKYESTHPYNIEPIINSDDMKFDNFDENDKMDFTKYLKIFDNHTNINNQWDKDTKQLKNIFANTKNVDDITINDHTPSSSSSSSLSSVQITKNDEQQPKPSEASASSASSTSSASIKISDKSSDQNNSDSDSKQSKDISESDKSITKSTSQKPTIATNNDDDKKENDSELKDALSDGEKLYNEDMKCRIIIEKQKKRLYSMNQNNVGKLIQPKREINVNNISMYHMFSSLHF